MQAPPRKPNIKISIARVMINKIYRKDEPCIKWRKKEKKKKWSNSTNWSESLTCLLANTRSTASLSSSSLSILVSSSRASPTLSLSLLSTTNMSPGRSQRPNMHTHTHVVTIEKKVRVLALQQDTIGTTTSRQSIAMQPNHTTRATSNTIHKHIYNLLLDPIHNNLSYLSQQFGKS